MRTKLVLIRSAAFAALFVVVVGLTGCAQQLIPNTDVEDNDFNRRVVAFCEEYRKALERRNTALLLQLADSRYYEDGGNIDATDDLDYAGLKAYLDGKFRETRAIRYEIRYRRVGQGRDDVVYVDYTYSASYKIPTEAGDVWRRRVADNRLELLPNGDSFKILSGM
ncbi:MAG TPA: hypothetical protein VF989_05715 [Polyangiaceae bacterium]|jgi:hypothetical protein